MSVFLQEIPARACQLYFGDFKEKQFSSDATAVIHTEVASSNKVSWRDALCCLLQSSPLPLQPVPVCLGGGGGGMGSKLGGGGGLFVRRHPHFSKYLCSAFPELLGFWASSDH